MTEQGVSAQEQSPTQGEFGQFIRRFEAFEMRIDQALAEFRQDFKDIHKRIDETNKRIDETNKRIDETNKRQAENQTAFLQTVEGVNKRIDETNRQNKFFVWGVVSVVLVQVASLTAVLLKIP